MPRRQRFKPSRKPKPPIEPMESEIIQPTKSNEQSLQQQQEGPDAREDRVPR